MRPSHPSSRSIQHVHPRRRRGAERPRRGDGGWPSPRALLAGLGTGLLLSFGRAAGHVAGPSLAPLPAPGPGPHARARTSAPPPGPADVAGYFAIKGAAAPEVVDPQRLAPALGQPAHDALPGAGAPDWAALERLFAHTNRVPLLARTEGGKVLLAYGSVSDAASPPSAATRIGVTNTARNDDRVSVITLGEFAADVRAVATQAGARAAVLGADHTVSDLGVSRWEHFHFAGIVRNWDNATTMMALRRTDGSLIELPLGQTNYILSDPFEGLWRAATGQNVSAPPPAAVPADSATLTLTYDTSKHAVPWLRGLRGPALAYSQAGLAHFVGLRDDMTFRLVGAGSWGGTHDIGRDLYTFRFCFLDSAQQGRGMAFTARAGHANVSATGAYTLAGVSFDDTVQVHLSDPQHHEAQLSLRDFRVAFGEGAVRALVTGLRTRPQLSRQQLDDGATYQPTPDGAPWFEAAPGPGLVPADTLNWAAAAVLACQLDRDPAWVQQMIRPSWDGNPHHVDVRFYDPATYFDPHTVTVDDWLPVRGNATAAGAPSAVGVPLILKALATFSDERLEWPDGPGGPGYAGLAAMDSVTAFSAIVGPVTDEFILSDVSRDVALGWVVGNASAGNLMTLTTLESNLPGERMDLWPSLVERRTYAVLGVSPGRANQTSLRLSGPWADGNAGAAGEPRWVPWDALQGVAERVTSAAPGIVE